MNCSDDIYKYYKAFCNFRKDTLLAYELFKNIYNEIPIDHRTDVLLKLVYGEFVVDDTIHDWINKCLSDETEAIKKQRIKDNKRLLQAHINSDSTILVYRGIKQGATDAFELSWSASYDVAYYFATRKGNGQLITGVTSVEDIITYNSNIREEEVIIQLDKVQILSIEDVEYDEAFLDRWEQDGKEFDEQMNEYVRKMEVSTCE